MSNTSMYLYSSLNFEITEGEHVCVLEDYSSLFWGWRSLISQIIVYIPINKIVETLFFPKLKCLASELNYLKNKILF